MSARRITAEVTVTAAREDKPITTLDCKVTNQDGAVVLDGSAVVWRDPGRRRSCRFLRQARRAGGHLGFDEHGVRRVE
jgi:hypothetical protein